MVNLLRRIWEKVRVCQGRVLGLQGHALSRPSILLISSATRYGQSALLLMHVVPALYYTRTELVGCGMVIRMSQSKITIPSVKRTTRCSLSSYLRSLVRYERLNLGCAKWVTANDCFNFQGLCMSLFECTCRYNSCHA
jgi:hypothetical protein